MERPRVFLSFSSRDGEFVRRLIARLAAQPVDVWVYGDEGEEIPGGRVIIEHLKERIDRSRVFIPLVSTNSFASSYTRAEIEHAMVRYRQQRLLILPLVSDRLREEWMGPWPAAYRELSGLRYREVGFAADSASSGRLDEAIAALCKDMQVDYRPPLVTDARLPFMERFVAEVRGNVPRRKEYEVGIYRRLLTVLDEFQAAFERQDYSLALARIGFFTAMCEYELPDTPFYYPYVVQGVCEVCCGQLDRATSTLESLLKRFEHRPQDLDENVYGALGYIKHQQGLYSEALAYYREASRRDPHDATARAGMLLCSLWCAEPVDLDELFVELASGRVAVAGDRAKVEACRAVALAHVGRLSEAETVFAKLVEGDRPELDIVVHYAHVLHRQGKTRDSIKLLERFRDTFADPNLLHCLASFSAYVKDFPKSIGHFDRLVKMCPAVRQYRMDAAQVYWTIGRFEQACETCAPLLDSKAMPFPSTTHDFFYDGFANWMHGNHARAAYDFARSGMDPASYYDRLLSLPTEVRGRLK